MKSLTAPAGEISWTAKRINLIPGDSRPLHVIVIAQTWMSAREQAMVYLRCGQADLTVEPVE